MASSTAVADRERAAHLGPQRRRPDVLDTALAIIVESGIEAVTMGALAERLDVTRPVVYACYPGRAAVLTALLDRERQRLFDEVVRALPQAPAADDPQRMLADMLRALLRTVAAQPDSWRALFAAGGNPAVRGSFEASRALVGERITPLLAAPLRRRRFKNLDRKLPVLVDYVLAVGERAIRTVLADDARHQPDELAELTARFLFAALAGA